MANFVQTFSSGNVNHRTVATAADGCYGDKANLQNCCDAPVCFDSSVLEISDTVGSLPSMLRKVMAAKFSEFDEYQLAKYNRQQKRHANSCFK